MNRNCSRPGKQPARRKGALAAAAGTVVLFLAVISCSTVHRAVVVLPDVPGAKYIGSKECEQCHDKLCRDFVTADHARLIAEGPNARNAGCESCHGPGSLHADSGGEVKPPFSFSAGRPQASSYGARPMVQPARSVETMCYQCHPNIRGQFDLPNHHPVPEGRLSCTACHSPHKGSIMVGGRHLVAFRKRKLLSLPSRAARPLRVRARGAARRMHHLSHRARLDQRQDAEGSRRQPLLAMPLPAGQRRPDPHRRIGPHLAPAARHLLERGLPRGGAWFSRQPLFALLTPNPNPDELKQPVPASTNRVALGAFARSLGGRHHAWRRLRPTRPRGTSPMRRQWRLRMRRRP